jgi:hypothetical protein
MGSSIGSPMRGPLEVCSGYLEAGPLGGTMEGGSLHGSNWGGHLQGVQGIGSTVWVRS